MELPDEAISYSYQSLLVPTGEAWTAVAEMRARHFLPPLRIKELQQRLMQCRSQVVAEREVRSVPPEALPVDSGFIDLPQATLDQHRRKGDASDLGRLLTLAARLREEAGRIVFLGTAAATLGGQVLFEALKSGYHNQLPAADRLGAPCVYFAGDNVDNDAFQELLDLLQITCVDPEEPQERWAVVCISRTGTVLEPALALRVFRREAAEYYGLRSEWLKKMFAAVTGTGSKLHDLYRAFGIGDDHVLTIPDHVSERFGVFTAIGLLPAAVLNLDVRAILLGAAAMTKRFLEEPFERNPVLQLAAVNYLMTEEAHKPLRVLSIWSKKLEAVGRWYNLLLAESLGKQGRGPTPLSMVPTRDLFVRGQQHQEGPRDRVINNLIVKTPRGVPIGVGMADHNEDDLNTYNRKGMPDLMSAALHGANQAYFDAARPTADLVVPTLSEHTMGQLLQMLMLATVVEGRLMGINPYSEPGVEVYRRNMRDILKSQ